MPTDSEMILIRARRTMKQTKNEIIKQIFYRKTEILTLLILGSFLALLTVVPPSFSQSSETKPAATPKPTRAEEVLDEDAAEELIAELKKSLKAEIEDKESVKEILEKWDADELVGKTRRQALEILFAIVKSVIEDEKITDKLWEDWTSDNSDAIEGAAGAPSRDMSRYNAMKRIPLTEKKTWTFNTSAGPIRFQYSDNGGVVEFTPNSTVGRASIAWIQVVRTGGKDRWYVTEADLMRLSKNKVNYPQRTDAVYGFRVDKTKGENTPFWEQTPLKTGETLASYRVGFDYPTATTRSGGTMRFSDNPDASGGLQTMQSAEPANNIYRFHFLLSPMNTETGEIYGTVEWGVLSSKTGARDVLERVEPSLVKTAIPELKGRDLAFDRWNTIYARQYSPLFNYGRVVYPIPGQGRFWGR